MGRRGNVGGFGPPVWVWWLVSGPVDFRYRADRLLVHVREVLGREPLVFSVRVRIKGDVAN